jgi:hypothetical protein
MDSHSPLLVEFVVTIKQQASLLEAHNMIICKMICRRVASLTSYVCVDMVNRIPTRRLLPVAVE